MKNAILRGVSRLCLLGGVCTVLALLSGAFDEPVPTPAPLPPGVALWPSNASHPFL